MGGATMKDRNCKTEQAWKWLWEEGGVGFCPLNPTNSVLLLWGLSTLQLIVPSFFSLLMLPPWRATKYDQEELLERRPIDKSSYKGFRCTSLLSGPLSEGVTLMALASGMKYTGAVSLSYPLATIKRIKREKEGFMLKTEHEGSQVWEQTQHGWQFRCVKELQKLYSVQVKRLWFILVFKYSFQMNVQVTLFILKGTLFEGNELNYFAAFAQLVSLGAMTLGIMSELIDLKILLSNFLDIRSSVLECLKGEMRARHFFKGDDGCDQEETLTGQDLQFEYRRVFCTTVGIVLVMVFCMWLIGYQMLKFLNFWRCPDHVWSWENGCLALDEMNEYLGRACQATP